MIILKKNTTIMGNYYLRQIRVPVELYRAVKVYCASNRLSLKEFYDKMLAWYLTNNTDNYQASYKKGQIMSLWLSETKLKQVKKLATTANVSEARVVFTALKEYAHFCSIYR